MSKKQANLGQENQNLRMLQKESYLQSKIRFYESFGKIAKRLESKGLLNEENYAKLNEKNVNIYFGISILYIVIALGLAYCGVGFLYILLSLFFAVATILSQKRTLNKFCYLYTFGEVAEGEVLVVDRVQIYMSLSYKFNFTVQFEDRKKNTIVVRQENLYLDPELKKTYKSGNRILIYYDPQKPKDAVIFVDSHSFYNLSLTTKAK